MKIHPLADRVVVEPDAEQEVRKGGIFVPDTAKEKPQQGKVVAIGAGRIDANGKRVPLEVKKGDRVLFKKYSGTEVEIGDHKLVIMREEDILATM